MEAEPTLHDPKAGVTRFELIAAPNTGPVKAGAIVRTKPTNKWQAGKWIVVTDTLDVTTRLGRVEGVRAWRTRRIGPIPFYAFALEAEGRRWLEVDGERTPYDPARHKITGVAVSVVTPL